MKLAKTRCSFLRGASKYSTIEIVFKLLNNVPSGS